jgi:hypothetical protein
MLRRSLLAVFLPFTLAAKGETVSLRGSLRPGATPLLVTQGKQVPLTGDKATLGVLADQRLADADFEINGAFQPDGSFLVNPIHTRAMFVHKQGKRLMISYWCEVCSIRTYSPGPCMCCQDETALDLKERFDE